uniref:Uncharacterized protein n=1 Tax=Equus caballus TaxID=9796 RepID=A0A9L0SGK0_HORSE
MWCPVLLPFSGAQPPTPSNQSKVWKRWVPPVRWVLGGQPPPGSAPRSPPSGVPGCPGQRKKPAWDGERRPHDLGRLWGAGAILHRGSPGLSVGPVPLLVVSLLIAASVFMSHIWSKDIRPQPPVRRKNFNVSQTIREKTELKRRYWDS